MSINSFLIAVPLTIIAAAVLVFAGAIAINTAEQPHEMVSVTKAAQSIDRSDMPPLSHYTARDGATLAYRAYPADPERVAVVVHGSVEGSSVMHAVSKTLQAEGITVYAPDMRGHGASGRRGDIDYLGQLDDDLADLVAAIRPAHPHAKIELVGFSSGASFSARIAGGRYGELFDRYVLLSPTLSPGSPTVRANSGGWVSVALPRAIALSILDRFGVHWFENLPIVLFATAPGSTDVTSSYSYRLARNFGSGSDYVGDFRNCHGPMTVLIGSDDEINIADRYAPLLTPVKPDLTIKILPGIKHINLVSDPQALSAIAAAAAMPLEHKADAK